MNKFKRESFTSYIGRFLGEEEAQKNWTIEQHLNEAFEYLLYISHHYDEYKLPVAYHIKKALDKCLVQNNNPKEVL